uniref:Uncharacterized protein n=1 Tax=Eutreptiella gymnastica TaxID=73025 RepID=A0A7S4CZS4_9EUGL
MGARPLWGNVDVAVLGVHLCGSTAPAQPHGLVTCGLCSKRCARGTPSHFSACGKCTWEQVHGARTVRTVWGNYTAFNPPNWTHTERYYTATLALKKQPENRYHMTFLQSKVNLDWARQDN